MVKVRINLGFGIKSECGLISIEADHNVLLSFNAQAIVAERQPVSEKVGSLRLIWDKGNVHVYVRVTVLESFFFKY